MSGHECPTCDRVFDTDLGVKIHHVRSHDESLVQTEETCYNCGVAFIDRRNRDRERERAFCGRECRMDWMRTWTGENHPRYNSYEVECVACGSTLIRPQNEIDRFDNHVCHGPECIGKYLSERFGGQDGPLWKGGRSIYHALVVLLPGNWEERCNSVRERAGYECRMCGDAEAELYRSLDVHHIIPIMAGGTNGEYNLLPLCPTCHKTAEEYTRSKLGPYITHLVDLARVESATQ